MLEGLEDHDGKDFVAFVATGARGTGQYRCSDCGYGITIHAELPECPMCGGNVWEETAWSPISNAATTTTAPHHHPAADL